MLEHVFFLENGWDVDKRLSLLVGLVILYGWPAGWEEKGLARPVAWLALSLQKTLYMELGGINPGGHT